MNAINEDQEWLEDYVLLIENRQRMDEVFQPMIYFLFDGSLIVYIGQSRTGLTRVQAHASSKKYTHFAWIPCPVHLLNNTEAYYILKFKPKYNLSLPGNEVYKKPKEAVKMHGMTMREAREWIENFDDIPVHEFGGNEYIATYRIGYDRAESDVWFPPIEKFTNEEVSNDPYLAYPVVDIRRCLSRSHKD